MSLVWIVFLVTLLFYILYGVVYAYHWVRWSMNPAMATISIALYLGVGLVLFGVLLGSGIALTL